MRPKFAGVVAFFLLAGILFGQSVVHGQAVSPAYLDANKLIEKNEPALALLWTSQELKDHPQDVMLRYRVANLIRGIPQLLHCFEHSDTVASVEFSPDGRSIVTACDDGFARSGILTPASCESRR